VLTVIEPSPSSVLPPGWGGQKVLWLGAPTYSGTVLIRGTRLDGDSPVRFQLGGGNPALPVACQREGTTFSTVFVFKAEIDH
jgi:hypothetical protein